MKKNISFLMLIMITFGFLQPGFSQTESTLWSETFEGDWTQNWHASSGTWEVGIPTSGPNAAHTGQKCAATVLAGNYGEPVDSRLIRHTTFVVPAASENPRLRFWHWYSFSTGDWGKVQISTDNGSNWNTVSSTFVNTGSAVWSSPSIDLSNYSGQTIQIAFYFHSEQVGSFGNVSTGWYVDDISMVTGAPIFNNPETWETGIGDWSVDKGTWETGIPTSGPGSAHTALFLEEFTSDLGDFTAYSVVGDQLWSWATYGNGCANMSGYSQSINYPNEDWLISPAISLVGKIGVSMNFSEAINYITTIGDMKVLISTDYSGSGNPSTNGTWTELTGFTRAPGNSWIFVNSGNISLAAFENQTIHIAFKYVSSSVAAATWEIDMVEVKSGQRCAATNLSGDYDEWVDSRLISPAFTVPASNQNPRLRFWHWYNISTGDYGKVQIKTVGSTSWTDLSTSYINTGSGTWSCPLIDLSDYAGQLVQFAFFFHSEQVGSFANVSTGWYIDDISIVTGAPIFNNPETWEAGIGDWSVDKGTWEIGTPTSGPASVHGGTKCAGTKLAGNYDEWVDSRLISPAYTVPASNQNPRLRLWHWYNISAGDYGKVQIRIVGSTSWTDLSASYINTGSGTWSCPLIDLSDYAGQLVQFAFFFHSEQVGSFANVSTGWYIDDISIVTGAPIFNNPETWEAGIGDWSVDKGTWEIGTPTSVPASVHGGTKCAGTKLAGNYDEWVDSRLISPAYTVPASNQNPRLRFWHWYNISTGDYGKVQIKIVGSTSWTDLSTSYINTGSITWSCPLIDLSNYAGQTVQFAFYFHSEQVGSFANVSTGWYIDDISIVTGAPIFNNPETWEAGIGDWSVDKGTWEVGTPSSGPSSAHSGSNCAGTRLAGNYDEWVESSLISPKFTLPDINQNPRLRFWHWYNFSTGDYGLVMIKPTNSRFWVGLSDQIINTSSGAWTYTYYDLSIFSGLEVQFAFCFHSEQVGSFSNVSSGWYIDDVLIEYTPYSDQFTLNSGWNLISFDNVLNEAPPVTIFQPLITTNNLQMVTGFQNQQGVFFNPNGLPFLNTLNHLVDGEGYWAKLQNAATLSVTGIPLAKNFTVDLLPGWNLIGYWPQETTTPALAFASLIAAGKLEMVTSYENAGKFFDPDGPVYLNTLTEIKNGFGYWVKLNAGSADFSYPSATWLCGDKLTDTRDGKSYETIKIGTQCWMKENLNTGVRIDGSQNQTNNGVIQKYCYDNQEYRCDFYGGLYQWDEMMQYSTTPGIQGICPDGWHLPTDAEWTTMINYLGGLSSAGGKVKTIGTDLWTSPNTGATNSSGMSILPCGSRYTDGSFQNRKINTYIPSSSQIDANNYWSYRFLYDSGNGARVSGGKTYGDPVRCIRNN